MTHKTKPGCVIVGGGPAGLMAAHSLSEAGFAVSVYDAMPKMGLKIRLAARSGLNLTHSEPFDQFCSRYGSSRPFLEPILKKFGPDDVIAWAKSLGTETFIGSSGRVFPQEIKSDHILDTWLETLKHQGVTFFPEHRWTGEIHPPISESAPPSDQNPPPLAYTTVFDTPQGTVSVHAHAIILALGGGSWPKLGSDGAWIPALQKMEIAVAPLKPANCGFNVNWTPHFQQRFSGEALKPVILNFETQQIRGEVTVTQDGLQGSAIYSLSSALRHAIETEGQATLFFDLTPDRSQDWLIQRLSRPRGTQSLSNFLRKSVHLTGVKTGLLYEKLNRDRLTSPVELAKTIKKLPVILTSPRPLEEAISSAGGICFSALNAELMVPRWPGLFCAGEMLDWEAPTGGYLMTACLSSGYAAGKNAAQWLGTSLSSQKGV